jgi:hypothetical protein
MCVQPVPVASAPAPAASPLAESCFVTPIVAPNAPGTLVALFVSAFTTAGSIIKGSGIFSLYAGATRYDIPFRDFVVEDRDGDRTIPTLVVVKFPRPTTITSAIVSFAPATSTVCSYFSVPWRRGDEEIVSDPGRVKRTWWSTVVRAASRTDAPVGVDDPRPCGEPDRPPRTVRADEPEMPYPPADGEAVVLVLLDEKNDIIGVTIDKSSGFPQLDSAAADSALLSKFEGETFRCRPAAGIYKFIVTFEKEKE